MKLPCRSSDDRGSILPLILGAFILVVVLMAGSVAAASAFLAQRDLQSVCDGSAVAAAQALDEPSYFGGETYPLGDVGGVATAYASQDGSGVAVSAQISGRAVQVGCNRRAHITFGAEFGYGRGLDQHARSRADARTDG